MPTTTATTGPPPTLTDAVRGRVRELTDQGVETFTADDFRGVAQRAGKGDRWLDDHLLVLEGIGVLRAVRRPGARTWSLSPSAEYLR